MERHESSPTWVFNLRQSVVNILKMPRIRAERRRQKDIFAENPFEFHRLPVLNGVETLYLLVSVPIFEIGFFLREEI